MYLRTRGSFMPAKNNWVPKSKSANPKKYMPNPLHATFAEGPQIFKKILVRKFADCKTYLRTAHL
jgi:hypothetical protein